MRDQGIGSLPRRRIKSAAAKVAVEYEGRTFTYADVEERSRRLANALREAGIGRGDRVAYVGFNHHTLLETFFATAQLGAIWVIINARLAAPEVEYILTDSGARAVVFGTDHHEHVRVIGHIDTVETWLQVDEGLPDDDVPDDGVPDTDLPDDGAGAAGAPPARVSDLVEVSSGVVRGYEASIAGAGTDVVDEEIGADDAAMIMYTSGTTGRPKGATHTHGSLMTQYVNVLIDMDVLSTDVTLSMSPLFHVAGLNMTTMPTFLKGGTIIIQPGFDADRVLATIAERGVTSMFAVPAMMDRLASLPQFAATDLSTLTNVCCGGSPLPDRMLRTWADRGVEVQQGFGMTETAPGIYLLRAADALAKSGTAGTEHFFTEARIVDPLGNDVPVGETGEIIAQGRNVMLGYWNRPEETARVIVDGWYHTGDLGSFDEDRFLTVRDRLKDMYISGGENIYPAEVENALLEIPGVRDAAVIGVPDPRWGEVGHAYVVVDEVGDEAGDGAAAGVAAPGAAAQGAAEPPTPESMTEELGRKLARYKVPKHIAVVDSLPRNATGKLQKHIIKQTHEETR
ncbi:Long-chain-fatty-acid--CoA ligase [Actinomycetales bacterium JB111]|nr:Long-chain-fatty-acid--CoA ligase [Actinomycetales bacterium JB111]